MEIFRRMISWINLKMERLELERNDSFLDPKFPLLFSLLLIGAGLFFYRKINVGETFFDFLRIVCSLSFFYFAYRFYKKRKPAFFWISLLLAILFNPFMKIVFTDPGVLL